MNKKMIFLSFISLFLISCKQGTLHTSIPCVLDIELAMNEYHKLLNDEDPSNDPVEEPRACDVPRREPGAEMTYNAVLRDFNPQAEDKMLDALERAKLVLNSSEFKDRVLDHTFNGEKTFVDNNGQSNAEIYETIMKASELLAPEEDQEMDLDITLYYSWKNTVGYTYPDVMKVWVNAKFFNGFTPGQVAANAVHEWTHKLGYGHSYYNNPERPYSVPYAVGSIIEVLVDNM